MASGSQNMNGDRYTRVFDVLELLVGHPDGMTVTEVSKRLGLPLSSTHNLLQRLVAAEVAVSVSAGGLRYAGGPRLVRLGIRVVDGVELRSVARRHLQELARVLGDDVYLGVRLGHRVVYVERIQGSRPITVEIRLGQSLFLHATSVGKLFAAHHPVLRKQVLSGPLAKLTKNTITDPDTLDAQLDAILKTGWSLSNEEAVLGIVGVAVPVFDLQGALTAAVHISGLVGQMSPERLEVVVSSAHATATAIEQGLGR
jgi:DNA-binding IclR family transcriptional regulator